MDIRKLQRAIVDGLEDVKAQNIVVFNTEKLSPLFERVIIASGTSNRQTKALASSVRETVKKRGLRVMATEGEDNGEWIIVDCGAAVAHIMQPAIRDYYHLEEIWGGKAVKMKTADGAGLPKSAAPTTAPIAATTKPAAVKKAAAKTTPARKTPATKKAAASGSRAASRPAAGPAGTRAAKAAGKPAARSAGKPSGTAARKPAGQSTARGSAKAGAGAGAAAKAPRRRSSSAPRKTARA